jgi:hypothetical protein
MNLDFVCFGVSKSRVSQPIFAVPRLHAATTPPALNRPLVDMLARQIIAEVATSTDRVARGQAPS